MYSRWRHDRTGPAVTDVIAADALGHMLEEYRMNAEVITVIQRGLQIEQELS